uniref:Copper transport protein n=1 Tax=Chromera velia CCMP2878 TaxID=1169474 RepID=A0A0G4HUE6_9ALVE|mmetsp:Transcript_36706/g.72227  ORF Transcript_36706/g.72227 Transcript_36706/m.72227 type:complete len:239 (+) Transcript_36706:159-875(+)|eukprot:Cvel_31818.t1-p1 / transcript=Cvel_31818.t1 / gene=Cvel_31818 / organism=Chromera_velia_CCMP2878 / gene_product=hypothetical protein / transcript_product=hypothetical protein / location=Cvel_scaffold4809:4219-4932(-) / protein_length=238 / sequence_SO=supercontig / SO=protein_coding / is_pseudo=false
MENYFTASHAGMHGPDHGHHDHGDHDHSHGGMTTSEEAFCMGSGTVMLNGMQFSFSPAEDQAEWSCVTYLFPSWVLDTEAKYAVACVGTFFLPYVVVLLQAVREMLLRSAEKKKTGNGKRSSPSVAVNMLVSLLYAAQMFFSYVCMLLVMLYEAIIFMCLLAGFGTSYFFFLSYKQRRKEARLRQEEAKGGVGTEFNTENDRPAGDTANAQPAPEADEVTRVRVTPCCEDAHGSSGPY